MSQAGTANLLDRHRRNQERAGGDLTPESWSPPFVSSPGGGGDAGAPEYSIRFARITGSTGDGPPYLYSATQVECLAAGEWTATAGGMTWSGSLRNVAEIAGGGTAEIPINSVVVVVCVNPAADIWVFERLEYRGTYG